MRTKLATLFCVVAMLAMALGPATVMAAGPQTWLVNGTYSDPCNLTTFQCKTIQAAVTAAAADDTISVAPGVYEERIVIGKALTLKGATHGISKNGYTVPALYAYDATRESIIREPSGTADVSVVQITADNVTLDGFIVENLQAYSTGSFQTAQLVFVIPTMNMTSVKILNNVIGPNTNTATQDGSKGRMAVYVSGHDYAVKVTIQHNKILDALGNGNGIMLWGPEDNEQCPAVASSGNLAGSLIDDNEITGNHRSGIEFAGKVQDVTISGNTIANNGGKGIGDAANLKYGNGIVLIRDGSDLTADGQSIANITITGNKIFGNEKNGIYMGPKVKNIGIAGNEIYDNGSVSGYNDWDGVRIDLDEGYHGGTPPGPCVRANPTDFLTGIVITNNRISGNGANGVNVIGTPTLGNVIATNNWWGSASGPGSVGLGSGDKVSANVIYDPWARALVASTTASTYKIGEMAKLNSLLTVNGLYGVQMVAKYDPLVLSFTSGEKKDDGFSPSDWIWGQTLTWWNFLLVLDGSTNKVKLAATLQANTEAGVPVHPDAATLVDGNIATWNYTCVGAGTTFLSYDATDKTGTLLSNKNGYAIPAALIGDSITCEARIAATVDGAIQLQGRLSTGPAGANWAGSTVVLTCVSGDCQSAGAGPYVFATDGGGYYSLANTVAYGKYTASVSRRAYLGAAKASQVEVNASTTIIPAPQLLGGDVDNSGLINSTDLSAVGAEFGNPVPADTGPDVNGDGVVNILDLVLVGGNFGLTSSPWS